MPVVRWEPYQDAASLQRLYRMLGAAVERSWMPAVDIIDTPEAFVFKAELAGMQPADVHIELDERTAPESFAIAPAVCHWPARGDLT